MNNKIKDKINMMKRDSSSCKKIINNYCSIKKVQELNKDNVLFKKLNGKNEEIIYD